MYSPLPFMNIMRRPEIMKVNPSKKSPTSHPSKLYFSQRNLSEIIPPKRIPKPVEILPQKFSILFRTGKFPFSPAIYTTKPFFAELKSTVKVKTKKTVRYATQKDRVSLKVNIREITKKALTKSPMIIKAFLLNLSVIAPAMGPKNSTGITVQTTSKEYS